MHALFAAAALLAAAVDAPRSAFLAEPYVNLGDNAKPSAKEGLSILWHADNAKHEWKLEYRQGNQWSAAALTATPIDVRGTAPFQVFEAKLVNLKPGEKVEYRVLRDSANLFSSTTMARKPAKANTRFVVFGDCAQGTPEQKQVAEQTAKLAPDYVFIAGDIVYTRGRISEYRTKYFPYYGELAKSTLFIGATGNHDTSSLADITETPDTYAYYYFWRQPMNGPANPPGPAFASKTTGDVEAIKKNAGPGYERRGYFSFDYGQVHWTVLDSNPYADWTKPELREWLENDLKAAAKAPWRIVTFHHPGFNSSKAHFKEQRLRAINDILERHNVSLVLAGHVHNYQRTRPLAFKVTKPASGKDTEVGGEFTYDFEYDGVTRTKAKYPIQLVTGAGGAKIYNPEQTTEPFSWQPFTVKFVSNVNSLTVVDAEAKKLTVRQISAKGDELDRFVITR